MRTFIIIALLAGCDAATTITLSGGSLVTMQIDPSAAAARTDGVLAPTFDGSTWNLGESTSALRYPVPALVGDTLTEWAVFLRRDFIGPTTTVRLQRLETVSALHLDVGPAIADSAQGPGYVAIGAHVPPEFVVEDNTYSLLVTGSGIAGDHAGAASVYAIRESPLSLEGAP